MAELEVEEAEVVEVFVEEEEQEVVVAIWRSRKYPLLLVTSPTEVTNVINLRGRS